MSNPQLTPEQQQKQTELNQQVSQISSQVETMFASTISNLQKTIFSLGTQVGQLQVKSNADIEILKKENQELRELCKKNNISSEKAPPKENKIAPPTK